MQQKKSSGSKATRRMQRAQGPLEPYCPLCDPWGCLRLRGGIRKVRDRSAVEADRRWERRSRDEKEEGPGDP